MTCAGADAAGRRQAAWLPHLYLPAWSRAKPAFLEHWPYEAAQGSPRVRTSWRAAVHRRWWHPPPSTPATSPYLGAGVASSPDAWRHPCGLRGPGEKENSARQAVQPASAWPHAMVCVGKKSHLRIISGRYRHSNDGAASNLNGVEQREVRYRGPLNAVLRN